MKNTLMIIVLSLTPIANAHLHNPYYYANDYDEERLMNLTSKKCKACEGGVKPLTVKEEDNYLAQVPDWDIDRDEIHKIKRIFKFNDFKEALAFVNSVGELAEDEGHHPDITIFYNRVQLELYTHAIKGLSENDFILASKIDQLIN